MNDVTQATRRVWRRTAATFLLLATTAHAQTSYHNPVMAGEHPDPSVIRVGKEYWATATSSEWGPQFPLLHSSDLVNWELVGNVFPHRPPWAVANFWAPEISAYHGRYFIYYVGRKEGGPLAVAVATAENPTGPYTDHGPLVAQDAGSIDPVPVTDEHDQRYLIWKEDGNSRKIPAILWAQRLAEDGCKLVGEPTEILRNDAPWEGAVVEGPFVVRRAEWFYLFYSGGGCCGRGCNYALGVARSKALLGPWEKHPANPLLAGNATWKCPGHGSVVQDTQQHYWLLYHAYSVRDFIYTGREALLDEIKFDAQGWPTINAGQGPSAKALSPSALPQTQRLNFEDEFSGPSLRPGWQWPQDNEPIYRFDPARNGQLLLTANSSKSHSAKDVLAATLACPTTAGDYSATAILDTSAMDAGTLVGLAALGDANNAIGVALGDGKLSLWRRDKGQFQTLAERDTFNSAKVHLRLTASKGDSFRFVASSDGQSWLPIGDAQKGNKLPPCDHTVRVALTVGGAAGAVGRFEAFSLKSVAAP